MKITTRMVHSENLEGTRILTQKTSDAKHLNYCHSRGKPDISACLTQLLFSLGQQVVFSNKPILPSIRDLLTSLQHIVVNRTTFVTSKNRKLHNNHLGNSACAFVVDNASSSSASQVRLCIHQRTCRILQNDHLKCLTCTLLATYLYGKMLSHRKRFPLSLRTNLDGLC